ncbi:MAG: Ig-like domain-containing protein [Planctomycetaceae bacterium]
MRRMSLVGLCALALALVGCTGGAAGVPSDDIGDIFVITHSPGNGDQLDNQDAIDFFNALTNPTLRVPGSVTIIFSNSLDPASVINTDPTDVQGSRNVRLFFYDTTQGPFDPAAPTVLGVNPPGANVLIPATTALSFTNLPNDTLILTPTGLTAINPLKAGQYSLIVDVGVRGADGDPMTGRQYFFFFRVGPDTLGPTVVKTFPANGERNVDPFSEIRITMSETILASTVNATNLRVTFQPSGAANPIPIPGRWFADGGNGPGNNFPLNQLDQNGFPGRSGQSPRNGVDLVFRPDLDAFPVNMNAGDPIDCFGTVPDPPVKGNKGLPLGASITVEFVATAFVGVTDTVGNIIPAGSPNTSFTFETKPLPEKIYAPNTNSAVFYGDPIGVGVIDVNPGRTPYIPGPNPARPNNAVVTSGTSGQVVRVAIQDLVEMTTDVRTYTAFYSFLCVGVSGPNLFHTNLYALSASSGGGEVTIIDTYLMVPLGRFSTPSPGGIGIAAVGTTARAAVSNFSANTVTVFDIGQLSWFTGGSLFATQAQLNAAVTAGTSQLILSESDFKKAFPNQRADPGSPPGPPIIGAINSGISPSACAITGLPSQLGTAGFPCFGPLYVSKSIVGTLNSGESTADFAELTNLSQSESIIPDLRGVSLSSQGKDIEWTPVHGGGSYFAFITGIGGTVELFQTGFLANTPSVLPGSASTFNPNKIVNSIGGLRQPSGVQWITSGTATGAINGYTLAALIAETSENRVQQVAVQQVFPSNLFITVNANHVAGLGPTTITGDPAGAGFVSACGPRFSSYYVSNTGAGTVTLSNYVGGVIGTTIAVPGVLRIASWWSR